MKGRALAISAVVALSLGATATTLTRSLWEPDETRYAEVAREMRQSGEIALLRLNGKPYTHKPPLFIWAEAGLQALGVPTTLSGVSPAFAALLLLLPALAALASATGLDRNAGALAFAILASSPLAAATGMLARMDILLALSHTVALVGLAGVLLPRSDPTARRRAHLLLWLAIGIGILIKGPVALVMPILTALLAWGLLRPRPKLRAVFVGWGPVLAIALVLTWLVPAAVAGGPEFLQEIVIKQSAGRLTDSFAHREPFYFHLVTYPLTGLPWSPLVILGTFAAIHRRALDGRSFLAVAVLAVILFFSVVSGKLEIYLLPLFPAAALLVGASTGHSERRWPLLLSGITLAATGIAVGMAPRIRPELAGSAGTASVAGGVLALTATAAVLLALRRSSRSPAVTALVLAGLSVPAVVIPALAGPLDDSLSVRRAGEAVARMEPDLDRGLSYKVEMAGLSLYAERQFVALESQADLATALAARRCVAVLEKDWGRVDPEVQEMGEEAFRQPFRRGTLLLVKGRAVAPRPALAAEALVRP